MPEQDDHKQEYERQRRDWCRRQMMKKKQTETAKDHEIDEMHAWYQGSGPLGVPVATTPLPRRWFNLSCLIY
jgi:hypothetical protein